MLLNQSPRGSFSVPVHITLQGARRRHMRDVYHQQAQGQETNWRRERVMRCNEKARTQIPESSVGEDRTILLGYTMMTFSVLMYFLVGITMVKPYLHSDWENSTNCSVIEADILDELMDCCNMTNYRCLYVLVNITSLNKTLRLHYNEDAVKLSPKCFYHPPCHRNKTELQAEASRIKSALLDMQNINLKCYISYKYPDDALLSRKYSVYMALYCMLWPSLMFFGGILLVGLVKLNQHLAFLCTEISREELLGKQSKLTEGGIYRLLRCRHGGIIVQHD